MLHRILWAGSLLLALALIPELTLAQKASIRKSESGRTTTTSVTPLRQGMILRNGKVMEIKGQDFTPLSQARTFPNGAVLQPNGSFTAAGGEALQLKEGDHVDLKGNLHPSTVVTQRNITVSGDTTGMGKQLLQAQQLNDRQKLLQEKQRILQQKHDLLQKTVQNKPNSPELKKLNADLARLQQQLTAEEKKKQ
ncbi:DUF6799 domain-containing protein [Rufibacter glacialis]|uniref:DUF6799 domain-containing protein n=1 Tax=Rufibacter glacialis TaxID=1259555 RepID=A0A5M8QSP9_9BACT|nr:DUF6799 domain-containing protein [Rufibacter glacialis]KAA6437513.1 hypothetical protein FOE74_03140 [Rufibacter glacialis]GGK58708.1 hypothetical protein GCM10011405_03480 [Rufibacter glacialis]